MTALDHMAPAADWGKGITRRAIRLRGSPGRVEAALEDMRHAMLCTLHHADGVVTGIDADFRRYTLDICPGASEPLRSIVGLPVNMSTTDFFANGRARQNCTHMLDLAWLALRHARRGEVEWLYEIEIPDVVTGPTNGTLRRNGSVVQNWHVESNVILAPAALAGQSLAGGFTRWVTSGSGLSDDEVEQCLILNKGFFMVGARRFQLPEGPLTEEYRNATRGLCFGYAAERIDTAIGASGMGRDFSHAPEKLLRFE